MTNIIMVQYVGATCVTFGIINIFGSLSLFFKSGVYACVCVCVCVQIYIYIYTYTHTHTHTHVCVFMCPRYSCIDLLQS